MKLKQFFLITLLLTHISACSYIREHFPDKEREYQLTREIPALVIPDDLSNDGISNKPLDVVSQPVLSIPESTEQAEDQEENDIIYVDLIEYSGGATRIRIEDSIERSWRTVGKALSRNSIEITDRNELDKVYFVQYDPDFKKIEDGSLWDEMNFLFAADPAKEKEFRVKLAENGSLTEIIVLDQNDRPLSSGTGLKLLNLMYKSIKKDLSNK